MALAAVALLVLAAVTPAAGVARSDDLRFFFPAKLQVNFFFILIFIILLNFFREIINPSEFDDIDLLS